MMDFGVHMGLMEEWNETAKFEWDETIVMYGFPISTVSHPHYCDGERGVMIAQYETSGEGDIVSLYVFDRHGQVEKPFNYVGK